MTSITVLIPLVAAIIAQNGSASLNGIAAHYFVSTGGSDFELRMFCSIGAVFLLVCMANFLFLRRRVISRVQLESSRFYRLFRESRILSTFRQPAWARIAGHLFYTTGVPLLLYAFASSKYRAAVLVGTVAAGGFLIFHTWLALREILHPRSTHNRRYLLFRSDPTFIKTRLLFGLMRRCAYFVFGFAVLSYGIHRLNPEMFTLSGQESSLFVLHLESSVNGLTKFGTERLTANGNEGSLFTLVRSAFGILGLVWLVTLMLSGLTVPGDLAKTLRIPSSKNIADNVIVSLLTTPQQTQASVIALIAEHLQIPESEITAESNLVANLGADSLDVLQIHVHLQEFFGKDVDWKHFASKQTVQELTALYEDISAPANDDVPRENQS